MKRLNRALLFILILLLLGLVALRVRHGDPNASFPMPGKAQSTPAPTSTAEPVPEAAPEPSPAATPEPTPVPAPLSGIALVGGAELDWPCGIPFEDPGFEVYEDGKRDPDAPVTVTGAVVPWHSGDYTLRYTLSGGDTAERTVHVVAQTVKEAVKPKAGTICLTYVDTPCEWTEELLTLLKRDEVRATFFVSTHQEGYLDLLTRIAEEGHEIGIYLPNMSWYTGEEGTLEHALEEIVSMQRIIHEKTGRYAKFIRFYGGSFNAAYLAVQFPGGYQELYDTMHAMGLLVFDWNLEVDVSDITQKVSSNFTNPRDPYDYVVAMQQNFHRYSVLAVPEMIRWAKEKEYTFSVLEDTFPEVFLGGDEWKPPRPEPETSPQPARELTDEQRAALEAAISFYESEAARLMN